VGNGNVDLEPSAPLLTDGPGHAKYRRPRSPAEVGGGSTGPNPGRCANADACNADGAGEGAAKWFAGATAEVGKTEVVSDGTTNVDVRWLHAFTEITHFRDFERVDVKNGINGASVGRDTLHRTKFSGLILSAGGRRGAGEACVDAANSVGERGASEQKSGPVVLLMQVWE